jgi:predicted TIM-barrel fold metal-dependent hydrolase
MRIIDGDGHVMEDLAAISKYLLPVHQAQSIGLFPELDNMKYPPGTLPPGTFKWDAGPADWQRFLDEVGIEASVMYPTHALALGRITNLDWAIDVCRAYNTWYYENYGRVDRRFKGIALIPMQDPEAAMAELERAIKELGMVGAFLPANGLKSHLGSKEYWPVYAAAERLGCCLAVHGGAFGGLGMDTINFNVVSHALGHPFSIAIGFAAMIFNGIFDTFPRLRVGFLEGGIGWLVMALERLDGAYSDHHPADPRGIFIQIEDGLSVSEYVRRHVENGQLFIGCEGSEPALGYAVRQLGAKPFIYSSDFPHEVTPASCKHEIDELLEREDIDQAAKTAILCDNSERFYALTT